MPSRVIMLPLTNPNEDVYFRDKVLTRVLDALRTCTEVYIEFPINPRVPEGIYTRYSMEWEKVFKSVSDVSCMIGNLNSKHVIRVKKVKRILNTISFSPEEFLHLLSKYIPEKSSKIDNLVFVAISEPDEYVYFYIEGDSIIEMYSSTRFPIQNYINTVILHSDYITISDKYTILRTSTSTTVVPISLIKDTLKSDSDAREEILSGLEGAQIV